MNRFFQHSFFNTYEEFGLLYTAAERHAHYPEGSWVSHQSLLGKDNHISGYQPELWEAKLLVPRKVFSFLLFSVLVYKLRMAHDKRVLYDR